MNIPNLFKFRKYLVGLEDCDNYFEFGADKAGLKDEDANKDDMKEFLELLNIDILGLYVELASSSKLYTVYSRDRKLVITMSSPDCINGYFHYFGMSGEKNTVLQAIRVFNKYCSNEELCFGSRDFC